MDQASEIREKVDIAGLISEYIPLKKAGRNFNSNCPFHNEDTPSFVVSPERQIWHCFGCGKGGDVYSFLMEYENMEFFEALQTLAKKTGVTLKNSGSSGSTSRKQSIYTINKLSSDFYNYVLENHSVGKSALEYLKKNRGLNERLIKTYKIGFAPRSGDALSKYLINKKKYKPSELVEAGVSIQKGPRTIDFFRDRIIFPLIDHRDNIVGFSGRSINDESGPKYINTKDTVAYHKGSMFFGFNQAKESIKKEEYSVVVEGEFDVITAYKEGIGNVVALKGTALTENQALLLSRFAPKVALCLDQDSAGMTALKRSLPILESRSLSISVVKYEGDDPDDSIKKDPIEFKKSIKKQIDVYDFLIEKLISENNIESGMGKKKVTDEILPLLSSISNEIVKEHYLKKLSEKIDISYSSLLKQIENKNVIKEKSTLQKKQKGTRRELYEEYFLALVLQSDDIKIHLEKTKDILTRYDFEIPAIGKIYEELLSVKNVKKLDARSVSKNMSQELMPIFDKCFLMPLPKFETSQKYEEEIIRVTKELKLMYLKNEVKRLGKSTNEDNNSKIDKLREEIALLTAN